MDNFHVLLTISLFLELLFVNYISVIYIQVYNEIYSTTLGV